MDLDNPNTESGPASGATNPAEGAQPPVPQQGSHNASPAGALSSSGSPMMLRPEDGARMLREPTDAEEAAREIDALFAINSANKRQEQEAAEKGGASGHHSDPWAPSSADTTTKPAEEAPEGDMPALGEKPAEEAPAGYALGVGEKPAEEAYVPLEEEKPAEEGAPKGEKMPVEEEKPADVGEEVPVQEEKPAEETPQPAPAAGERTGAAAMRPPENPTFAAKTITYEGRRCVIVLQDFNGPCPLLALVNILSLRGNLPLFRTIDRNTGEVPQSALVNALAEYTYQRLDTINSRANRTGSEAENARAAAESQALMDALDALPRFANGMDLNLKFDSIDAYEATQEASVCDAVGVRLVHGWLPDPQNTDVFNEINKRSYNVLVTDMCEGKAPYFSQWSEETRSQLTTHGLFSLHSGLHDGELCMFFRNNHFAVLVKHGSELFTLVTDAGICRADSRVVWESLADTDFVASEYVGENFNNRPTTPPEVLYQRQLQAQQDQEWLRQQQLEEQRFRQQHHQRQAERQVPPQPGHVVAGRPVGPAAGSRGVQQGHVVQGRPLPAHQQHHHPQDGRVAQDRRRRTPPPEQRKKKKDEDCGCTMM